MEYRRLGRTGEKVSTIGMGTWMFGTYRTPAEKASQVNALRHGFGLGINFVDTAEVYASGRSEEVVGEAIRGLRNEAFVATKVGPEHLRHDDVVAACKGSLLRLGTSYIDLYQVHWPDPRVPIRETMTAMESLVKEGFVRYIGVSNFSVAQTVEARGSLKKSELVSNQVEYSLNERRAESEVLPYCISEKLTLIAYSPLDRGHISNSVPTALLQKYGISPAQAMLNWVTRHEQVIAIPKSADLAHLEENASSVSARFQRDEYEQISRLGPTHTHR